MMSRGFRHDEGNLSRDAVMVHFLVVAGRMVFHRDLASGATRDGRLKIADEPSLHHFAQLPLLHGGQPPRPKNTA